MLNSSIYSNENNSAIKTKGNQAHLLSTAISKLGDSSFKSRNQESKNISPVRLRLFRDSPKTYKGLEGCVVGQYHPLPPTHVVYSNDKTPSPYRSARTFKDSPERAKVKLNQFKDWNSKLDIQLQIQNNQIAKLNNQLIQQSYQPYQHKSSKSNLFSASSPSNFQKFGKQSDISSLSSRLNQVPISQIVNYQLGHQSELNALQSSLSRIMKTSRI
ncbi:unnamed protein product [Paramecium primaurelia]|uniref:Uncharacterized protein n=1 Tax=Paramecium primaurelia TaxID=5886 RepID=A0A8S1LYC4_PARPR|nr:unnamed protein product [Paramecium primaurelia]